MDHVAKRPVARAAAVPARTGRVAVPGALGALTALAAVLSGCTGGPAAFGDGRRSPERAILVTPGDGARDIAPDGRVEVRVPEGRLKRVGVTRIEDAQPQRVPGRLARDGRSWTSSAEGEKGRLGLAATYRVDAVAVDGDGHEVARRTTFTTAVPEHRFTGRVTPENRATVGTGTIVSVAFGRPVVDRAAVERAVQVTTVPKVEVVGHWFGAGRLDLRPAGYWAPGTEVTVTARLRDVEAAPGVYGSQDRTVAFRVGRSQTSLVDVAAHTMEVRRDGQLVATVPITAGRPGADTYSGRMVVGEMYDAIRADGRAADCGRGGDGGEIPHALRLTGSGVLLHGDHWSDEGAFGSANVGRGCVGLRDVPGGGSDTPAGWFFDRTLVGDVIEVVNSRGRPVAPDDGLSGWNLSWKKWKAGSALRRP
ncbi:Ig-like domain-containing protein [Streptomyces sp. NPDC001282]|uniref:L,D-transpeptidase n=1 Tax=Streptomyces sp. NPDC001282 TaxID=3364557 RepID=UPI00367E130E